MIVLLNFVNCFNEKEWLQRGDATDVELKNHVIKAIADIRSIPRRKGDIVRRIAYERGYFTYMIQVSFDSDHDPVDATDNTHTLLLRPCNIVRDGIRFLTEIYIR